MFDVAARAFWVTGPMKGELRETGLRPPAKEDVLVRTLFTAVSRGTESLIWRGGVPESEHTSMRAPFQEGQFPWPVKYGYAAVGMVENGPKALKGRTVFCLHPHQDRFVVPANAVVALPDGVPAGRAILAANMETAVNGMWDAKPLVGERIIVVGGGVVGLLVAYLAARIPGTKVQIVDPMPEKKAAAEALGVGFAHPSEAEGDADLVIHASGNPAGLETALRLAGFEARIIEMSWFGTARVTLTLGEAFHSKRLKLFSSQVGHVPSELSARWGTARRMATALDLLRDASLDILISGECKFADLPKAMSRIAEDQSILCQRIAYD